MALGDAAYGVDVLTGSFLKTWGVGKLKGASKK